MCRPNGGRVRTQTPAVPPEFRYDALFLGWPGMALTLSDLCHYLQRQVPGRVTPHEVSVPAPLPRCIPGQPPRAASQDISAANTQGLRIYHPCLGPWSPSSAPSCPFILLPRLLRKPSTLSFPGHSSCQHPTRALGVRAMPHRHNCLCYLAHS